MKNIRVFYLEIFNFLVIKFSLYLNRHVFVMLTGVCCLYELADTDSMYANEHMSMDITIEG